MSYLLDLFLLCLQTILQGKQSFDQGMYKADLLLFVKQKDYGPMPKSGKQITLDKKRIYNIKSCSLKAGMYRMELERVR